MKTLFLSLCLLFLTFFLITACQKTYDPLSTDTTGNLKNLTVGSSWTYSHTIGTSVADTFKLTVIDKDTLINEKTYKVLTSSNGATNSYLTNIDQNYYRYPSLTEIGLESFEELYLKDNVPVNEMWTGTETIHFTSEAPGALVANWKMDDGSGTTLIDASNHHNNAQTTGNPTWTTGVIGQALKLDGSTQFATVPDNPTLNITGAITLAAWIKPEKKATQYIIKKAIGGSTDGYELSLSNPGQVFFRFNQATSGNTYRLNSTGFYPTNGETWMHIAATYDGSVAKIYLNGVENASATITAPSPISTNTLPLTIGAQSDGSTNFLGTIDEARVYNTALNATQIRNFIYSSNSNTLTANFIYTVKEKSVSHVVKGNIYNNVIHIRLDITDRSNLNIAGGDFYYAQNIGLIESNIILNLPDEPSITSKQELISYEIK